MYSLSKYLYTFVKSFYCIHKFTYCDIISAILVLVLSSTSAFCVFINLIGWVIGIVFIGNLILFENEPNWKMKCLLIEKQFAIIIKQQSASCCGEWRVFFMFGHSLDVLLYLQANAFCYIDNRHNRVILVFIWTDFRISENHFYQQSFEYLVLDMLCI